jgi:hypothetical protein
MLVRVENRDNIRRTNNLTRIEGTQMIQRLIIFGLLVTLSVR